MHVFRDLQPYICTFAGCCDMLVTFPTRELWSEHEFVQHRVKVSYKCHDCGREFANAEPFTRHLGEYHHLKYNQLQLRAFLSAAASSAPPSWPNEHCPLCLETGWASQRKFTTHVARHMEEIALASLPRDVGDDCDSSSNEEIESQDIAHDESGEDQGSVQAERDPGSPLRAAVAIPDGWIPASTSPPTFDGLVNGQYEGPVAVERARTSSATFLCSYCPERFSRKITLIEHQHECKRKSESGNETIKMRGEPSNCSPESEDGGIKFTGPEWYQQMRESSSLPSFAGRADAPSFELFTAANDFNNNLRLANIPPRHSLPVPTTIEWPEWSSRTHYAPQPSVDEGSSTRPPRPNLPTEPRYFKAILKDPQDDDDVPGT
jgi:hypothetical protein